MSRRLLLGGALVLLVLTAGVAAWLVLDLGESEAAAPSATDATTPAAEPQPPTQSFRSRPDLRPPLVTVNERTVEASEGYVFLAPKRNVVQAGPMILDARGELVWFRALDTRGVADFRAQRYRGEPVLTWWRGRSERGIGDGHYVIFDRAYRPLATVRAGNGLAGDIHEFLITPRDTALITIYNRIPWDLSALGGPREGAIQEGVVQELDIETGRVLFEWHSAPHVEPAESYAEVPDPAKGAEADAYDYFHINSVGLDDDGDLLVSARNTHAVYKIRRSDGEVEWRLGGKRSDFRLGPGVRFAWQHDARRQADGTVTLFDNAAAPQRGPRSRVLAVRLDEEAGEATLERSWSHPQDLLSRSQANAQFLPGGRVFVGWGSNPYVTEFDRDGRVLFDARFGTGADSYRAYLLPWRGEPAERPALAAEAAGDGWTTAYASWNGATEVERWRVLAGAARGGLEPVATVPKAGFETPVPVRSTARFFAVEALGRGGAVLGRSPVVARRSR